MINDESTWPHRVEIVCGAIVSRQLDRNAEPILDLNMAPVNHPSVRAIASNVQFFAPLARSKKHHGALATVVL